MRVGVIGGGVAGSSVSLYLGELGVDVTLFEREESLISGPPFCHLHAGGNLYPDISDEQCLKLLKQSIDFARFYPQIVDKRPTVLTFPNSCELEYKSFKSRLNLLQKRYEELVKDDIENKLLGEPENYYKIYQKDDVIALKDKMIVDKPKDFDEWMIPFAKYVDLDSIKFPVILVQEYGLNLFRLSSILNQAILKVDNIELQLQSKVINVKGDNTKWEVSYINSGLEKTQSFDYLINAAGFRTGIIDDMIGIKCQKMVEFKAAYVTNWSESKNIMFPEIIFHGKRGTPKGMGQFTPYPQEFFQLHGMTEEITLYKDGLVANKIKCQPELGRDFIQKIEDSWEVDERDKRTTNAIKHISQYIPQFQSAKYGYKPLYGAQQIPGDDPSLRVAEVSFPTDNYARCEIVKVSSVFDMIDSIVKDIFKKEIPRKKSFESINNLDEKQIAQKAKEIASQRDYPKELSSLTTL